MSEKICVKCSAENPEHFTYCKYCGAFLPVVDRQAPVQSPDEVSSVSECETAITKREYAFYADKNGDRISDIFETIEHTGSKTSWCSPPFVLGLFFGFYGISAWFLCRKMKKTGFLILLLAVILTAVDALINAELNRELYSGITQLGQSILSADIRSFPNLIRGLYEYFYLRVSVSSFFGVIASFTAGLFALNIYKNKADTEIMRIKAEPYEYEGLPLGTRLRRIGGRNDLWALLPLAVCLAVSVITFAVTVI